MHIKHAMGTAEDEADRTFLGKGRDLDLEQCWAWVDAGHFELMGEKQEQRKGVGQDLRPGESSTNGDSPAVSTAGKHHSNPRKCCGLSLTGPGTEPCSHSGA